MNGVSIPPPPSTPLSLRRVLLLYTASGLPFGVVTELVPGWRALQGDSLSSLGHLTASQLPWSIKFLWAPVVDLSPRPWRWIFIGSAICSGAMAGVPSVGSAALPWILGVVVFGSATMDIALDGQVTRSVPDEARGRVNGLRVAAYRLGLMLAGGGAVALLPLVSPSLLFPLLGGLTLIAAWAGAGKFETSPSPSSSPPPGRGWWRELAQWASAPTHLLAFAFVLLFKLGDAALTPMTSPFWVWAGRSALELGAWKAGMGTVLTVLGALLGGEMTSRWGLRRALWTLGGIQAVTNLGYVVASFSPGKASLYLASAAESFGSGLGTAVFLSLLMLLCARDQAGTRFALLTALAGGTRVLAGMPSGDLAAGMGFPAYFAFTFLLALPALALLPFLIPLLESSTGNQGNSSPAHPQ